jgi:hypothetical protein
MESLRVKRTKGSSVHFERNPSVPTRCAQQKDESSLEKFPSARIEVSLDVEDALVVQSPLEPQPSPRDEEGADTVPLHSHSANDGTKRAMEGRLTTSWQACERRFVIVPARPVRGRTVSAYGLGRASLPFVARVESSIYREILTRPLSASYGLRVPSLSRD